MEDGIRRLKKDALVSTESDGAARRYRAALYKTAGSESELA
jgi:hypothetical protein